MNGSAPLTMALCKRTTSSGVFQFFFYFSIIKKKKLAPVGVARSPTSRKNGCGFANFVFKVGCKS
jgi:hypothetical protein